LKVSVVVPSYNHAHFLGRCIESVLGQTYADWELLILDDGSSDESVAIARSYEDPRIRVHTNPQNLGTYGTENRGIDSASGDLIAILNSDDFWQPDKLELQVDLLRRYPEAPFSYTRGDVVDDQGDAMGDFEQHRDYPTAEHQNVLPFLLEVNQILASSVVFRRGKVRFDEQLRYSGDWVAALRLAQQGPAVFVDQPLTAWRQHGENASKQLRKVLPEEVAVRRAILDEAGKFLECAGADVALMRRKLALTAVHLGAHLALAGERAEAVAAFGRATELDPTLQVARRRRLAARILPLSMLQRHLWPGFDPQEYRGLAAGALEINLCGN
jgi:glycosyltransferase involved in cell wall biosynthesis